MFQFCHSLSVLTSVLLVVLSAGAARADVFAYYMDNGFVDADNEAANLRVTVTGLGHTANNFTGATEADFTAALGGVDGMVLSEMENGDLYDGMDAGARTVLRDFVEGGGLLLITARDARAANLINNLFGESLVGGANTSGDGVLTAAAGGTSFEGGPATLPEANAVYGMVSSSLPGGAMNIYEVGGESTLFVLSEGSGYVAYLGFDWYEEPCPAAWEAALGTSLTFTSNFWDGSESGTWSTAANWSENDAPEAGNGVIFAGATNTAINHDRAAGTEYASILFRADAGAFTLSGNGIGIADSGAIINGSTNTQTIVVDVTVGGAVEYDAASGDLAFSGTQAVGGGNSIAVIGSSDTAISGQVTGGGSLSKAGTGTLTLSGANDFAGGTTLSAGTVIAAHNTALGSGGITVAGSSVLQSDDDARTLANAMAINNGQTVTVSGANDLALSGNLTGSGGLAKSGVGALVLSGTNGYAGATTLSAGTLTFANAGSGPGGSVSVSGGTLQGTATIGGGLSATGGTVAPGNSIGTMTVGGAFTLDGSTLAVELDNTAADKIVANSATLTSGTLRAVPLEPINARREYTVIETTAGVGGDPADLTKAISNDAFLLDFDLAVVGNNLVLTAAPVNCFSNAVTESGQGGNRNLPGLAGVLDDAAAAGRGGADMATVQGLSQSALVAFIEQTQPQIHQASAQSVHVQNTLSQTGFLGHVGAVQSAVRHLTGGPTRLALADGPLQGQPLTEASRAARLAGAPGQWVPWLQSLNDVGRIEDDAAASGYKWQTHGFNLGAETLLETSWLVGGGVSMLWTDTAGNNASGSADTFSTYANVYASWFNEQWHVAAGFGYGHAWTDTRRPVAAIGAVAMGDYESDVYSGYLSGGYLWTFEPIALDVEPFVTFDYSHTRDGSNAETGAGAFNLNVNASSTNRLRHVAGLRFGRTFDLGDGAGSLRPSGSVSWTHDYLSTRVVNDVDLLGGTFRNTGVGTDRDAIRLTAGVDWLLGEGLSLFVNYAASLDSDWHSHSANAGLRLSL